MKTRMSKEKIIAATTTALLVVSLIGTGVYYRSNNTLKGGMKEEKLKSESLLSEKLALSKEAEKLKNDIQSWKGKSEQADRLLAEALDKVAGLENTVRGLRKENATLASVKKELSEVKQIRKDLEDQLAALDQQNRKKSKELEDMQSELISLRSERDGLRSSLNALQASITDNFRVEPLRGRKNQKLTINAARTRKLMVSFEIPQSMSDNIKFSIVTPSGKVIKSDEPSLTYRITDDGRTLTASLSPFSGDFEISRRVEMTYSPAQKLDPGIYNIQIYNDTDYAGSVQLRLR
ncbi:MAG: hypothetical protein R6W71_10050 [Bacteroidales bacterium]|jgi:peptidoglycan hydrolase CwlO-like protein